MTTKAGQALIDSMTGHGYYGFGREAVAAIEQEVRDDIRARVEALTGWPITADDEDPPSFPTTYERRRPVVTTAVAASRPGSSRGTEGTARMASDRLTDTTEGTEPCFLAEIAA